MNRYNPIVNYFRRVTDNTCQLLCKRAKNAGKDDYFRMYKNESFICIPGCYKADPSGICSVIYDYEQSGRPADLNGCVIMQHDIHRKYGVVFRKLCLEILLYFKHEHPYMSRNLITLKFGFIVSDGEESVVKGACGCDSHADGDIKCKDEDTEFTLFINPLLVPLTPDLRSFSWIFRVAVHEMVHLMLYTCNPEQYSLGDNVHDETFVEMIAQIDDYFYDTKRIMGKVW